MLICLIHFLGRTLSKIRGGDKKKSKFSCMVCSRTTNRIASNKDGVVQCSGCDLWWHPTCAQMSKEKFQLILMCLQEGSQSPWKCTSCKGHGAKLMKLVTAVSANVEDNEKKLADHAGRMERVESKLQETRLDYHKRELRDLKEQVAKMGDMGGPGLMREMEERSAKENCLVFHRVGEAGGEDARVRIAFFKKVVQQILNHLGVEIGWSRISSLSEGLELGQGKAMRRRQGGPGLS